MKSMTIAMTLFAAFLAAPSFAQGQRHDIEHLAVMMAGANRASVNHNGRPVQAARGDPP